MWYEILPTLGVFTFFFTFPFYSQHLVNLAVLGKPKRRTALDPEDRRFTMRDDRMTGDVFKLLDLDSIPDE